MPATRSPLRRGPARIGLALAVLALTSCGDTRAHTSSHGPELAPTAARGPAPASGIVATVGRTRITGAVYDHWLAIGEATVKPYSAKGPLPNPVIYDPPAFGDCVARLSGATIGERRRRCERRYNAIQTRVLDFLIVGYWLREAAARHHLRVSSAELRREYGAEVRKHYATVGALARFEKASRQTRADLEFALETQMLSSRLIGAFAKKHPHEPSERAAIQAFNSGIKQEWVPRTTCARGYVVTDCKQYEPPTDPRSSR